MNECQARSRAIESDVTHSHLTPSETIDCEAYSDLYPAITAVGRLFIYLVGWSAVVIKLSNTADRQRWPWSLGLPHEHQREKKSFLCRLIVKRTGVSRIGVARVWSVVISDKCKPAKSRRLK